MRLLTWLAVMRLRRMMTMMLMRTRVKSSATWPRSQGVQV